MKYSTKTGTLAELSTPCLITGLKTARRVARELGHEVVFTAATSDFKDSAGQVQVVGLPSSGPVRRILVTGGADDDLSAESYRKVIGAAATALKSVPAPSALWALNQARVDGQDAYWKASAGIFALSTALYAFDEHKSTRNDDAGITIRTVQVHADARTRSNVQRAVRHGNALKSGLDLARNLGNQPPNVCNPPYLVREARKPLVGYSDVTALLLWQRRRAGLVGFHGPMLERGAEVEGPPTDMQRRLIMEVRRVLAE